MDMEILKTVGQIAGIGGLALGVFLILFKEIIRKSIFPQLAKKDAYRLLRLISVLVFLIAALGIGAWVWVGTNGEVVAGDNVNANCSAVNTGTISDANVSVACDDKRSAQ
jgi:hypothetical protein